MSDIMTQQALAQPGLPVAAHLDAEWALFEAADSGAAGAGWRVWEAATPTVVVGRSNRIHETLNEDACRRDRVPVLRRESGGGAVVLGPGCLNYAVVLPLVSRPALLEVEAAFRLILHTIADRLGIDGIAVEGRADLALLGRKVSGNAQRRGRRALLHHGTLLYDFDSALAARYLTEPVRRPAYRGSRTHAEFMGNVPLCGAEASARLAGALKTIAAW